MTSRARPFILVLTATFLLLALGSSPLSSQEGEEARLAIGFMHPDGRTGVSYLRVEDYQHLEPVYEMGSAVPSEPLGHQLVRLTNLKRVSQGVPPLRAAPELMASAQFHSNWMASHNCFGHSCSGEPDWVTRIVNAGYSNRRVLGENIAAGFPTASSVVNAWMSSSSHRDNMLNSSFREAGGGYGYSSTSQYRHYWTLDIGQRDDGQGYPLYPIIINNEAWTTVSAQVELYLHGSGWADQMRFRNQNDTWSQWEPFSASKPWTLSCLSTPATIYAQIRQGTTVLESSDQIHVESPLDAQPNPLVFLSEQGASPTIPESYQLEISCCDNWSANADRGWIKLSGNTGTCPTSTVTPYLQAFPTTPGLHTGTITVQTGTAQEQEQVQVILVVTDGPLEHSDVPLVTREQT